MKKLLLFIAVTVIGFSAAQSQELRLGAKAGVNFSSISGDAAGDQSGLTSFHIGALVEIPINEKFSVQPELLYSSQGAFQEVSFNAGVGRNSYESTIKLDYINIPIMAKYYVIEGLSIEAGPQFGVLVSAKSEVEEFEGGKSKSYDEDVKDFYKTLDIGLGLGAAYRLNNGIFFSARYVLGISKILNTDNVDGDFYSSNFKQHNNVFQVSLGYSF